jgi:hypothetical protein
MTSSVEPDSGCTPAAKAPARRPICGNGASDASLRWRGFPSNYVAIAGPCRAVTRTSSRPLFPAQRFGRRTFDGTAALLP